MIKIIKPNGAVIKLDYTDTHLLCKSWWINDSGYAVRSETKNNKKVRMHREIMRAPKSKEVDHINGDRLDNTRNNLRLCTSAQNKYNTKLTLSKGVREQNGKWSAYYSHKNKYMHIGVFSTKDEAIIARRKVVQNIRGVFFKEK